MSKLHLEVFTGSEQAFQVTSTIIYGDKDAILVDAQFLLSDAHRLTAQIIETGKNLTHIYITHFHPDHYFGLNVLHEAFSNAKIVALPNTVEDIRNTFEKKVEQWKPSIGHNVPHQPIIPEELKEDKLILEGNELLVKGGLQGDTPNNSYVWIPSLKAVITGDIVYNNTFAWTLETDVKARTKWLETLQEIENLHPEIVVAGHRGYDTPNTADAIEHTRKYLIAFDEVLAENLSSEEIQTAMKKYFPNVKALEIGLVLAANAFGGKK
ncbi:MBL fold metallo-hydrolase [Bacillus pseudomycoides]|uniref:MBL fold metallo-hydrolase n=1 Tax=Bacillus TaxID=1386 RepID=UPI000BED5A77|nr:MULTISPECIES: MBL fold metallo-hydrolase [Bacillus]MCX2826242.1 MBL fold metallo-hydrolase [Bacillus sp. DHT2]MDR4913640.1 MBL fold metallo-hydrolase [Bacillus pseudomycoides]MED4652959.1 MBL fold metallo-hydrolase [Bacillus pseudomycoides]PDY02475.1 MBL fold metallo-hydrolase [Bacillus pseudomycoides]PEE06497.1 MBL fold metallo-hydrolase [Bacillus pseudomycoides]